MPVSRKAVKVEEPEIITERSRRRAPVSYAEDEDEITASTKSNKAPVKANKIREKRIPKSAKNADILEPDHDLHIPDNIDPSDQGDENPIIKGSRNRKGRKKKVVIQEDLPDIPAPFEDSELPPPPPLLEKNEGPTECNRASESNRMLDPSKTMETGSSEDEDVAAKEQRRIQKEAAANPFSFKNYVAKVATRPINDGYRSDGKENINSSLHGSSNDLGSQSSLSSVEELREENVRLQDELDQRDHLLRNRNRRIEEMEKELKLIREREKKEAEKLDKQFQILEKNYKSSMERVRQLELEVYQLEQKNQRLRRSGGSSGVLVEVPEEYIAKSGAVSQQLSALAEEGQTQLKIMMTGLAKVQQMADVIGNLHKFSEDNASGSNMPS